MFTEENCRYIATNRNGFMGKIENGNINFLKMIRGNIESHIKIIEKCSTCRDYYFCTYEKKEESLERSLCDIYQETLRQARKEYNAITIIKILHNYATMYPIRFSNDLTLSAFYNYLFFSHEFDINLLNKKPVYIDTLFVDRISKILKNKYSKLLDL